MIARLWYATLNPECLGSYRRFEREQCLPMLYKQAGFLGVLFARAAEDLALSITIWEDGGAVEALESSPSYREMTRVLTETSLLANEWTVELLEVTDGVVRVEALVEALDQMRSSGAS